MEDVRLPEVFPSVREVSDTLKEAFTNRVKREVKRLACDPISSIGIDEDLVVNSILHHEVKPNTYKRLIEPSNVLCQVIGVFLNECDLIHRIINYPGNPIVNADSMKAARVYVDNGTNRRIVLVHHCGYKPSLERYLSSADNVSVDVEDNTAKVTWSISLGSEDADPLTTFYSGLIPALIIYHKLLTRFSLCQTYQNSLPGFVNS